MSNLPIIAPLLSLLQSRKFLLTIAAIVVNIVIIKLPELAFARDILMGTISLLVLGLVTNISWEDRAKIARDAGANLDQRSLEELIKEAIGEGLDAVLEKPTPDPVVIEVAKG